VIFSSDDRSRFILPVSGFARQCITPGTPRFGARWTCCTENSVVAKTSTSAFGMMGRALLSRPGCSTAPAARRCSWLNEGTRTWLRCSRRVRFSTS
jgi:hypothetical protein